MDPGDVIRAGVLQLLAVTLADLRQYVSHKREVSGLQPKTCGRCACSLLQDQGYVSQGFRPLGAY